jgi:hypothetical protein
VKTDNRRYDIRGVREEKLFIKVASCKTQPSIEKMTLRSSTLDVSASGMRLLVTKEIPVGTILDMWVEIKGNPGKFLLQGKVMWNSTQNDEFLCGVELVDTSEDLSDLIRWRTLFK